MLQYLYLDLRQIQNEHIALHTVFSAMNVSRCNQSPSRNDAYPFCDITHKSIRKISVRSVIRRWTGRLIARFNRPRRNVEIPPPPPVSSLSQYAVFSDRSQRVYPFLRQHGNLRATQSDPFLSAHASYPGLPVSPYPTPPEDLQRTPTFLSRTRTKPQIPRSQSALDYHTPPPQIHRTPKPKPRYPGSRRREIDQEDTRYMAKLTRLCAACGRQNWQCANASNYTGNEWRQFPRINVRVAPQDHDRVLNYYHERINRVPSRADSRALLHGEGKPRSSRKIKLYVVPRNGCEDRPVEVRVGVRVCERRGTGRETSTRERVEVYICEGKRAEIVHYMRGQIEEMRFGKMATAYLVDRRGGLKAEALLVKETSCS